MKKRKKPDLQKYIEAGARVRILKSIFIKFVDNVYEIMPSVKYGDKVLGKSAVYRLDMELENQLCLDYPDVFAPDFNYGSFDFLTREEDYMVAKEAASQLKEMLSHIEKAVSDWEERNNAAEVNENE